jgi:hypothetical protein
VRPGRCRWRGGDARSRRPPRSTRRTDRAFAGTRRGARRHRARGCGDWWGCACARSPTATRSRDPPSRERDDRGGSRDRSGRSGRRGASPDRSGVRERRSQLGAPSSRHWRRTTDRKARTVDFDIPQDLADYLVELDEFIEREIVRSSSRTTTSASSTTDARTPAPTGNGADCPTRSGRRCCARRAAAPTPPATTATRSRRSSAGRTAPTSAWRSSASTSRQGARAPQRPPERALDRGQQRRPLLMINYGTDEQKAEWIDDLAEGRRGFAFGITEPEHGSDATHMETSRRPRRRRVGHQRREDLEHRHPQGAVRPDLRPHERQGRRR